MSKLSRSKHSLIFFGFFLLGLVFALCLKYTPKTFAEDEDDALISDVLEDKFITVYDNNKKLTVRTSAVTVQDVLERLNISLDSTDSVSPELSAKIDADHFFINIYRSRPVIVSDGHISRLVNTSAVDARSVARSAGFVVYDSDIVSLEKSTNFLESGVSSVYKITRGEGSLVTVEEDLPFSTNTIRDYNLKVGTEEIRQLGELGKVRYVYEVKSIDGEDAEKTLVSETVLKEPVEKIVAVGTAITNAKPLTATMGRNRYTAKNLAGEYVERQETFYDLPMNGVMSFCGKSGYTVRSDGVKVDDEGYILIAADLSRYPRCTVVETSLGLGKVYDTGSFALTNPEQFDIATDWTNRDGR